MARLAIDETIFHRGHYRFALARTMGALPADPEGTAQEADRGPRSQAAEIETDPKQPILFDKLWPHTERPTAPHAILPRRLEHRLQGLRAANLSSSWRIVPGVQEGGFSYHHCAISTCSGKTFSPCADQTVTR